jgi:hypothetical protein
MRWSLCGLVAIACAGCFPSYSIGSQDGGPDATSPSDATAEASNRDSGDDAIPDAPTDANTGSPEAAGPDGAADLPSFDCDASFPATGILDPLDGDAGLGPGWSVAFPSAYGVSDHDVFVTDAGFQEPYPGAFSWRQRGGVTQEVYVTLDQFVEDLDASVGLQEIELLLKGGSPATEDDAIYVDYTAEPGSLGIWIGYSNSASFFTWVDAGSPVILGPGAQLGARACGDGTVRVYVDGGVVVTTNVSAFVGANGPGYFGFYSGNVTPPLVVSRIGGG